MYVMYEKMKERKGFLYSFKEQVSLFGCNVGYIPRLLKNQLEKDSSEPLQWYVNIESSLKAIGQENQALVIYLKPYNKEPNLSLYELIDVWGYSSSGWTPVMFYLRGIFIDEDPSLIDEKRFIRSISEIEDPIFSMTYLSGTVRNGTIYGRWTPPGPGSTNSVLLWPDTFEYFASKANEIMDKTA